MTVRPSASTVSTRQSGVVKKNSQTWVVPDGGGGDFFAHSSQFPRGFPILQAGCRVTFTIGNFKGRSCAEDIRFEPGWLKWLLGKKGYEFGGILADRDDMRSPDAFKTVSVMAINALQRDFKTVMQRLAKSRRSVEARLFYAGTCKNDEQWLVVVEHASNIRPAVHGVRMLVADRLYSLIESGADPLLGENKSHRSKKLASLVRSLSRGSGSGPNAPLQWSGHGSENGARFTLVTEKSMLEMVDKLGSILELLFEGRPVPDGASLFSKRAVNFALRAAFAAPSIDPAKMKWTKKGLEDMRQKHTNPSDVFKALIEAWDVLPIESEDLKEAILISVANGLNYMAPEHYSSVLGPVMSYLWDA